jgi:hypothetical protein
MPLLAARGRTFPYVAVLMRPTDAGLKPYLRTWAGWNRSATRARVCVCVQAARLCGAARLGCGATELRPRATSPDHSSHSTMRGYIHTYHTTVRSQHNNPALSPSEPQQHGAQHHQDGRVAGHGHGLAVRVEAAQARAHQHAAHQARQAAHLRDDRGGAGQPGSAKERWVGGGQAGGGHGGDEGSARGGRGRARPARLLRTGAAAGRAL